MFVSLADGNSSQRALLTKGIVAKRKLVVSSIAAIVFLLVLGMSPVKAQAPSASEQVAATAMTRWKDSWETQPGRTEKWSYDQGVVLKGIESLWLNTADGKYFQFIQRSIDRFVRDDGTIRTYELGEYNIDHINNGRILLLLYSVTGQEKYRKAAALLREQLKTHPRTSEGGFWHKQIYPYQMWLDGLYMGEPFYAEYAATFHDTAAFDDIARQFVLMELHSRDAKTGLLYHAWDESRKQRWANTATGRSPNFWGRAMGWYAMALVDTLDYFPADHPQRAALIEILKRLAVAAQKYQEPKSGLWYEVLDQGKRQGNYLEASVSCMFVYALAKGVRQGYLPPAYLGVAQRGYRGILSRFIKTDPGGQVNLEGTVSVGGLGGNPYRDGSYEYYLSEKVVTNDTKGVGAFLMASQEMERVASLAVGRGKTVTLDSFFNNEVKQDATGLIGPWHYKWEEMLNSGYFFWGNVFRNFGAWTRTLAQAPTAANLSRTDIYIIVDPDTKAETANPNFIEPEHVAAITQWVKRGGVLVLLGNDAGNAEFDHFNQLAKRFGVQFNQDSKNRVQGNDFAAGSVMVAPGHPIFKTATQLYLKEISTLTIVPPAQSVMQHKGDVIMATTKLGKGTVFAVGDPWLYNEYVEGRKLPPQFENFKAAQDLSRWLIRQSAAGRK
ncbi:MAG TPA: glycoside hydrolase family 88 protein [Pyrinomonadaceae bacterium]|jgi:unsaturated rhamnogalacturonyl hydrolase|nr:glycoside hydrolase family 88 protein [Pyrinomonadaceae bacterium]